MSVLLRNGDINTLHFLLHLQDSRINPYVPDAINGLFRSYQQTNDDTFLHIIQLLEYDARVYIPAVINFARAGVEPYRSNAIKILEVYILSDKFHYSPKYNMQNSNEAKRLVYFPSLSSGAYASPLSKYSEVAPGVPYRFWDERTPEKWRYKYFTFFITSSR